MIAQVDGIPARTETDRTILLVEDDPVSRDVIVALCEARGYAVDVAADGFLGLRLLNERRHRLALVDYHLPEMDGYALARLMRGLGVADLRLVGISADGAGLAARRGSDALFDAILLKPLDPAALFAALEAAPPAELRPPSREQDARAVAAEVWRRRGLPGRPVAAILPAPTAGQRTAVAQCFDVTDHPADADLILVVDRAGVAAAKAWPAARCGTAVPIVALFEPAEGCEATFRIDDGESWSRVAEVCRRSAHRGGVGRAGIDREHQVGSPSLPDPRSGPVPSCAPGPWSTGIGAVVRPDAVGPDPATGFGPFARVSRPSATLQRTAPAPRLGEDAFPDEAPQPPLLDHGALDQIACLVGTTRIGGMIGQLRAQLVAAFRSDDRQEILRQTHAVVASAGILGCARLAMACRWVERAARDRCDMGHPISVLRAVRDETVLALDARRDGPPPTPPRAVE